MGFCGGGHRAQWPWGNLETSYGIAKMDGFNHKKLGSSQKSRQIVPHHSLPWNGYIHGLHGAVTELCQGSILDLAEFLYAAGTQTHEGFIHAYYVCMYAILCYDVMWYDLIWCDMIWFWLEVFFWLDLLGVKIIEKWLGWKEGSETLSHLPWKTKACFECPTRRGRPRTQYMIYISVLQDEPDIFRACHHTL